MVHTDSTQADRPVGESIRQPGSEHTGTTPRPVHVAIWLVIAAMPGMYVALTSPAWSVQSYESNCSDALVFRVSAELLASGQSPYDTTDQAGHIAATRLDGNSPPYVLPFAYPPNALPLLAIYHIGSPRFGYVLFVATGSHAGHLLRV